MQVIWALVYTSVYLHIGVLNYDTVRYTSSLLACGKHKKILLNISLRMLHYRMVFGAFLFLSVFDKRKFNYCNYTSFYSTLKIQSSLRSSNYSNKNFVCKSQTKKWMLQSPSESCSVLITHVHNTPTNSTCT